VLDAYFLRWKWITRLWCNNSFGYNAVPDAAACLPIQALSLMLKMEISSMFLLVI